MIAGQLRPLATLAAVIIAGPSRAETVYPPPAAMSRLPCGRITSSPADSSRYKVTP